MNMICGAFFVVVLLLVQSTVQAKSFGSRQVGKAVASTRGVDFSHVPKRAGLYQYAGPDGKKMYTGESKNLRQRLKQEYRAGHLSRKALKTVDKNMIYTDKMSTKRRKALESARIRVNDIVSNGNTHNNQGAKFTRMRNKIDAKLSPWKEKMQAIKQKRQQQTER